MRTSIFKLILFVSLFAPSAWARNYIVGGQDVGDLDPVRAATVGIFDPSPDGQSGSLCTGTLIRDNMAVTAAHCVPKGAARPVVIFGKDLHSPGAIHRQVEAVAVNPKWQTHQGKGMDQGDIALVKFDGGLPAGYKKVAAVTSDKEIQAGSEVTLAGYGISNAQTKTGAGRLRKTKVDVLDGRHGKSEMILDQSHGRGACHGDSGGPAFVNHGGKIELAGVTNRGYPDRAPDDCAHQVVYTKVPAYRPWIRSTEKKLDAQSPSPASIGPSPRMPGMLAYNKRAAHSRSLVRANSRPIAKSIARSRVSGHERHHFVSLAKHQARRYRF